MFIAQQLAGPIQTFPPKNVLRIKKATAALNTATTILKKIPVKPGRIVYIEAAIQAKITAGELGLFLLKAAARNVSGTTSLLGTASLVSFRDGTEITVTVAADNTADTLNILGTAAVATNTDFSGQVQVTDIPNTPES